VNVYQSDEVDIAFDAIMTALSDISVGTGLDILTNTIAYILIKCEPPFPPEDVERVINEFPEALKYAIKANKRPPTEELN
jgi:hypothetical protein